MLCVPYRTRAQKLKTIPSCVRHEEFKLGLDKRYHNLLVWAMMIWPCFSLPDNGKHTFRYLFRPCPAMGCCNAGTYLIAKLRCFAKSVVYTPVSLVWDAAFELRETM
jgi:hypothetical protein